MVKNAAVVPGILARRLPLVALLGVLLGAGCVGSPAKPPGGTGGKSTTDAGSTGGAAGAGADGGGVGPDGGGAGSDGGGADTRADADGAGRGDASDGGDGSLGPVGGGGSGVGGGSSGGSGAGESGGMGAGGTGTGGMGAGGSGTGGMGTGGLGTGTGTGGSGTGGRGTGGNGTGGTGTGGTGTGGTGTGGTGTGGTPGTGGSGPGGTGGTPLALSMIANPDPAVPLGFISYEIKLSNLGSTTLQNVVLTESTNNAATTIGASITGGGRCPGNGNCVAGTIVTWPALTLAPGQTQVVWFISQVLNATANGTLVHNSATVTFPGGTVTQSRDVLIDATQPLNLAINEDRDPVKPGDQLTYTVVVGNGGAQSLPISAAAVLTASIPSGTTLISASASGAPGGDGVQWNVNAVDPGGSRRYTYTVLVGSLPDGTLLPARAQLLDGATSLVRALTTTEVRAAAPLRLTMTVNPDPVVNLGFARYEIKLSNLGSATLQNVVLTETTENNATTLGAEITGGGSCPGGGNCFAGTLLSWPAFTLAPGQTQTVSFLSQVVNGTLDGTLIHNAAAVAYPGGVVTQSYDVVVNSDPGLHVGLEEDHDPVKPGDRITYTVVAGNTGNQNLPVSAAGVLSATVPAGTTFVSASGGGTLVGNTVQWSIGSVNPGGNQHYAFVVTAGNTLADGTVLQSLAQLLDGTVSVTRAMSATTVQAGTPLALTMTMIPDPGVNLGLVNYELRLSNLGSSTLQNVVLSDSTLNDATGIGSVITGGGACPGGGNCFEGTIVTWPAFTLAPGQTQTVYFTSQVVNGTPNGTLIQNDATVVYPGGSLSRGHHLVVDNAQALHLAIEEDHDPVTAGDAVTYTLVLGNSGVQSLPLSAAGVLTATVPTGAAFVSASGGGTLSGDTVSWNVGAIDPGGSRRFTYTVTAGASLADGTVLVTRAQLLDGVLSLTRAAAAADVRAVSPIKVAMTVLPDPAPGLGLVLYQIKLSNLSASTFQNVLLSDSTLNDATVLGTTITAGGACPGGGNCFEGTIVRWPAFTLGPGQTQTVSFTSQVVNGTRSGILIHNAASVVYPGGMVNLGHDLVVNNTAPLQLGVHPDHNPVAPGDAITYTATIGNTGAQNLPLSAAGVLTVAIPSGASFVSASSGGTQSGNNVVWNIGAVSPGGSQRYTYVLTAAGNLASGTLLPSLAQLTDSGVSLARANTTTEVRSGSPLTLTLSVAPDPVAPLALAAYTLLVTNVSAGTLANVLLTDSTRNDGTGIGASISNGGACPGGGNCFEGTIISWPAFALGPGQSQMVTFNAQIVNGTPDGTLIRNAATLNYPGGSVSQDYDLVVHR